MGRKHDRNMYPVETRLDLLEGDTDIMERTVNDIDRTLKRLTWAVVGAVISLGTSAVLLAINLVTQQ